MFKENVGTIDRIIRVVLGLVVLSLAFVGPETPFGYLGIIFIATGLMKTCPIYSIFGMSTCPLKKN